MNHRHIAGIPSKSLVYLELLEQTNEITVISDNRYAFTPRYQKNTSPSVEGLVFLLFTARERKREINLNRPFSPSRRVVCIRFVP